MVPAASSVLSAAPKARDNSFTENRRQQAGQFQLTHVSASNRTAPEIGRGQINATLRSMVDTGAEISTIRQSTVQQFFRNCATRPATAIVHNYDDSV